MLLPLLRFFTLLFASSAICAVLVSAIAPYDPLTQRRYAVAALTAELYAHWFGTDDFGPRHS